MHRLKETFWKLATHTASLFFFFFPHKIAISSLFGNSDKQDSETLLLVAQEIKSISQITPVPAIIYKSLWATWHTLLWSSLPLVNHTVPTPKIENTGLHLQSLPQWLTQSCHASQHLQALGYSYSTILFTKYYNIVKFFLSLWFSFTFGGSLRFCFEKLWLIGEDLCY